MKKLNFKNTTILITGASSGIGEEFAKQLASKGANLVLTARTQSDLRNVAEDLESEYTDIWIKTIPADLSELNGAQYLIEKINDLGLSIDYLINNAGFGKFCEFSGESFQTYQKMMMLNNNALVELTHFYLPAMRNRNNGGIINGGCNKFCVTAYHKLLY
ncbi:SDR family NAD(P)-dependent oxidoreductase [bacterium]|nr:SDR family NAD(P)-dependent oxidoreductase [bacterium]MDB4327288.1 SDR family NAD(P)-dependent oxidoreductase [bacterium]